MWYFFLAHPLYICYDNYMPLHLPVNYWFPCVIIKQNDCHCRTVYIFQYVFQKCSLTLILLTWRIRWAPNNASIWQMGFNWAFKGLNCKTSSDTKSHSQHAATFPVYGEPGIKFCVTWHHNSFKSFIYQQMHLLLTIWNVKIYIKISCIRSYMFRSSWTILRELTLSLAKVTQVVVRVVGAVQHALHGTHYTHHNLCNFSQAQCKLPEDGPTGPKHVGANTRYFNVNFNISYG